MGVKPAIFQSGGKVSSHYIPGGYSRIDYVKSAGGLSSVNNAVLMGDCRGGEPNKLIYFSTYSEAKAVLRSGALLDAIKHSFNCSPDYSPQRIAAWRVNPGLQATYDMLNGSDEVIKITAWDWGLHSNQLKLKLQAGSTVGQKLTLQFMTETEFVVDDILRNSFSIVYTGSEASCALSISETTLTTTTATHTQELSITLASFPTIQDLVNYINDQPGYECTISTLVGSELSNQLDKVAAQSIKTTPYTATSNLQAIIDALKTCPWVYTAEYLSDVYVGRVVPDNITSWVYFTGGTDGAYTSSEWATSLTAIENEDVQFIGSSNESSTIHALIRAHCESMNSVEGKNERQFILGGATGETVDQVIVRAQALNSSSGALVYPEFQDYNSDDTEVVWWSPAYYAAKLIGLVTCLAIPEPMTNKQVSVLNFKTISKTNMEKLIRGGVAGGWKNKSGEFITVRMLNTYQGSVLQQNEFSMQREALFCNKDLRETVEKSFVGKAMTNSLIASVDTTVSLKLNSYVELGLFNGTPPYSNYKKTVNGDQILIEYDCYLTPPTNFLFITSHMAVYASSNNA